MNNTKSVRKQRRSKKKLFLWMSIIVGMSLLFAVYIINWEPKPDPASELAIKKEIFRQFYKAPNDLTNEDLIQVKELFLTKELYDIKFLEKLPNLQKLRLEVVVPLKRPSKWLNVLQKLHLYKNRNGTIDLRPLKKLKNLKN